MNGYRNTPLQTLVTCRRRIIHSMVVLLDINISVRQTDVILGLIKHPYSRVRLIVLTKNQKLLRFQYMGDNSSLTSYSRVTFMNSNIYILCL